jgi:endonuclease III
MTVKNEKTLLALITSAAEADNTVRRASDQLVDVINTTARLIRKDPETVKTAKECGLHPVRPTVLAIHQWQE